MSHTGEEPLPRTDPIACEEMGRLLAAARAERQMSPAEVAYRLLLSTAQIRGLEMGRPAAFHNAVFFAKALGRYASLLGVTSPLMSHILVVESPSTTRQDEESSTQAKASGRVWPALRRVALSRSAVVAGLVIACTVGVALYRVGRLLWGDDRAQIVSTGAPPGSSAPAAAPPVSADSPVLEPLPSTSADQSTSAPPQTQPSDVGAGRVALSRTAWVFVRYRDNSVVERTVQSGGWLSFTSVPVYLAIGAGDGVTLTLGGRTIDLTPFTRDGEIRLRAVDLEALAASAQ